MHISWNPCNAIQPHKIASVSLLSVATYGEGRGRQGDGSGRQKSGGDTFPGDSESIALRHLVLQRNTFMVDLPVMQRPSFTAVTFTVVTFPHWQSSLLQVTRIRDKMSYSYVSQPSFLVYYICRCDWPSVDRMSSEQAYVFP